VIAVVANSARILRFGDATAVAAAAGESRPVPLRGDLDRLQHGSRVSGDDHVPTRDGTSEIAYTVAAGDEA
jgi:hypothetical protein